MLPLQNYTRCQLIYGFTVIDLSFTLLKGLASVCSNRSVSQNKYIFENRGRTFLKDSHLFAATDHHRKVQTVSPSVLDLSINFLEGRRSIISKGSSSESRKQFLLLFSTCPSISFKDSALVAATDHHRKVEIVSPSVLELSINFV